MASTKILLACVAACGAVAALALPAAAGGGVACGDTIGPKAKVTLSADISLCAGATSDPALTIEGPATVDFAGHRLFCDPADPPGEGILILGRGVKLLSGGVADCTTGVQVEGEGKHSIEDFVSEANVDDGIRLLSDRNKLKRVAANDNLVHGFEIDGDSNRVEDAVAIRNGGQGFEVDGERNKLTRITAVLNTGEGFLADQGGDNQVKEGAFISSDNDGVELITGGNKIEKSVAIRNGVNPLSDAAFDSRDDVDQGEGNVFKGNRAYDNPFIGFRARDRNNLITKNVGIGNGTDAIDENAGGTCGTTRWTKNVFGTTLADATPDAPCIE